MKLIRDGKSFLRSVRRKRDLSKWDRAELCLTFSICLSAAKLTGAYKICLLNSTRVRIHISAGGADLIEQGEKCGELWKK